MVLGAFALLLAVGASDASLFGIIRRLDFLLFLEEKVNMSLDLLVQVSADSRLIVDIDTGAKSSRLRLITHLIEASLLLFPDRLGSLLLRCCFRFSYGLFSHFYF